YVDVILYYLRKKSKQQSQSNYRYTTTNYYFSKHTSIIILIGLPWHLTDEVYVLVNCNGEFHWVLTVVVLKEQSIKMYDSMSSSRTHKKLSTEIQKLSTMLPKYLESNDFFSKKIKPTGQLLNLTREKTNLTHSKSNMLLVLPNKQAMVYTYHIIILCYHHQNMILLARSDYVSNNEDPQGLDLKKQSSYLQMKILWLPPLIRFSFDSY
ncbi:hypothetical protein H5410_052307, partial [Solanum commersonii]